ncbi:MAG: SDR family oxidoreductase [Anaerolineae bacterium]|jgi:NAD(P)-dependent dehydrogenase (short-subunit alcohol dehydrogenase family)
MSEDLTHELFDLQDKVAVITGGGGVLCGTLSRALGKAGAKVAVLDIITDAAEKVAQSIVTDGGEAIAVRCNVLDKASIESARDTVLEAYGRVDILINGAGGNKREATTSPDMPFFDLPADAVQWVFNLNFIGTLLCSQVFGQLIANQGSGSILNISSMNAFRPLTKIPAYSAAKAAVSNFTQWLAVHMSQEYSTEVRVNAIAPGFFLTEQNRFLLLDEASGEWTPRGQQILDHTPMGKFGKPEDLIGTVLWLLSPGAQFVHGVVVPIDGGFSAYSGV